VALKYALLALAALPMIWAAPAGAVDARFYSSLKRLDPATRLEQVCDVEAMKRINSDTSPYHPDRAKSDVLSTPHHIGDTVKGNGGAFRSKGKWYSYSFVCKGSPDHFSVVSFTYKIGGPIPETKWASYGLWR
jgi:hypothetical protein